jgi:hypothetical protein
MKKQLLIVGIASVLCTQLAQAGAVTELRTVVKNNQKKGDIWATWKSATTTGKVGSAITHGLGAKHYRYLQIPAGKQYTMAHTGDKIHVYAYPCEGKYVKYHAKGKGYKGMEVTGSNGNITITEIPGSTQGGATAELRTHVYNKTDGDIWVTWKSSTTTGKIFTTPFHWMREHRFVLIKPGESYTMVHTGDKLALFYYAPSCQSTEGEYSAKYKGYARMDVDQGAVITESISSSKKGVTPK